MIQHLKKTLDPDSFGHILIIVLLKTMILHDYIFIQPFKNVRAQTMQPAESVTLTPEHNGFPLIHFAWDKLHPAFLVDVPHGHVLLIEQPVPLLHIHVSRVKSFCEPKY